MITTNFTLNLAADRGELFGGAKTAVAGIIDPVTLTAMAAEFLPEFGATAPQQENSARDLASCQSGPGLQPLFAITEEFYHKAISDCTPAHKAKKEIDPRFLPALEPQLTAVATAIGASPEYFDVAAIRRDFPALVEKVAGTPLVWLDNAATTHKPRVVLERLRYFYEHENSNVHRGAHTMAARATAAYEGARETAARFLNAATAQEIVFTRGTTEAINLAAQSFGRQQLRAGDEVIVSWLEHHANIVPWQMICAATGAKLRIIPVDQDGQLLLEEYQKLLGSRTKIVAVTHISNTLGTVAPVAELVGLAHQYEARVLIDGAQAVAHLPVDVQALDCDFYVFSGHKLYGPTGIGVLYGKTEVLQAMPPYQGGGNMIADVTFAKTVYQAPPHRFEAGTGNIAGAVGLGAALAYVRSVGLDNIYHYERQLLQYARDALSQVSGLTLMGAPREQAGILSFALDGWSAAEVGRALDRKGIAVRAGHHCAQPILRRFGRESTVRASLAFYNTVREIDFLVTALRELVQGKL
jgi:cysteine desulfurase/selenocysteine lyase